MPSISVNFNDKEVLGQAITDDEVVIGRQQDCTVHIDNLGISRQHAKLSKSANGYTLHDLGSANGTFLNGQRVAAPTELSNGDQIQIGKYSILYHSEITVTTQQTMRQVMPTGGLESDVMSTMAMDSNKIKQQMEELKRQKESTSPEVIAPKVEEMPATNNDAEELAELRAKDAALELNSKKQRTLIISLIVVIAVVIVVAVLVVGGGK